MDKRQTLKAERLELFDRWGRKIMELGARDGTPYAIWFDGKRNIRKWLTFLVDGTVDIKEFKKLARKEVKR